MSTYVLTWLLITERSRDQNVKKSSKNGSEKCHLKLKIKIKIFSSNKNLCQFFALTYNFDQVTDHVTRA